MLLHTIRLNRAVSLLVRRITRRHERCGPTVLLLRHLPDRRSAACTLVRKVMDMLNATGLSPTLSATSRNGVPSPYWRQRRVMAGTTTEPLAIVSLMA